MSENFPSKWGYKKGLDGCVGKTIEKAESVNMEFGCTWNHAWVVLFTDGTKAFFVGSKGSGMMNPDIESMKESNIFTPEEVGEFVAEKKRERDERIRIGEERDRRQYERLKKQFEKGGG